MSNEDKMFRELFEGLKNFSDDKERYISEIINNAIFNLINRRNEKNDELNKEKNRIFIKLHEMDFKRTL